MITFSAQGHIVVTPDHDLRRLAANPVRKHRQVSVFTHSAKSIQFLNLVRVGHQIEQGSESLSPKIAVEAANVDLFLVYINHFNHCF